MRLSIPLSASAAMLLFPHSGASMGFTKDSSNNVHTNAARATPIAMVTPTTMATPKSSPQTTLPAATAMPQVSTPRLSGFSTIYTNRNKNDSNNNIGTSTNPNFTALQRRAPDNGVYTVFWQTDGPKPVVNGHTLALITSTTTKTGRDGWVSVIDVLEPINEVWSQVITKTLGAWAPQPKAPLPTSRFDYFLSIVRNTPETTWKDAWPPDVPIPKLSTSFPY
ncbi:hypothetical protein SLS57_000993 [Botryosphaeria dothidea]